MKCTVKNTFQDDIPNWISLLSGAAESWNNCIMTLEGHKDHVRSVAFSPDGKFIASASFDNTVKVWAFNTGKLERTLEGHTSTVDFVAFSFDSEFIVSVSDRMIKIWDTNTGDLRRTFEGHPSIPSEGHLSVSRLTMLRIASPVTTSPDGRFIVSVSWGEVINVRTVDMGDLQRTLDNCVSEATFSPNKRFRAAGLPELPELPDNVKRILSYSGYSVEPINTIDPFALSPNGKIIASVSRDNTVKLWIAKTGDIQQILSHTDTVGGVAFSPDGKFIASASDDGTVKLWIINTGELQGTFDHTAYVNAVAFSPDGKYIASGSSDGKVRLWIVDSGKLQRTFNHDDTENVRVVAFSPNGRFIVSTSPGLTIKIWLADTGDLQQTLRGGRWSRVIFSPDSKVFA